MIKNKTRSDGVILQTRSAKDKRKTIRFRANKMAGLVSGHGGSFRVQDFSLGGISVEGTLPKEEEMVVQLFDADGSIDAPVAKVRSFKSTTSLRFTQVTDELRDFIGFRVYTEVLRKHQPTVLLFGTNTATLMEHQRAELQKKYKCDVLATNSLLGLIGALQQSRPPVSQVIIGEYGFASKAFEVAKYLEDEQPNIGWVIAKSDAEAEEAVKSTASRSSKTMKFSS